MEVTFWNHIVVVYADDGTITLTHDQAKQLAARLDAWLNTAVGEIEGAAI